MAFTHPEFAGWQEELVRLETGFQRHVKTSAGPRAE